MANLSHRQIFNYSLPDEYYRSSSSRTGQYRGTNAYGGAVPRAMYINPQDVMMAETPLSPPLDTYDFAPTLYTSSSSSSSSSYMVEDRGSQALYPPSQRRRTAPGILYHDSSVGPMFEAPLGMPSRRSSRPNSTSRSSGSNGSSKNNIVTLTPPTSPQTMSLSPSVSMDSPVPASGAGANTRFFCQHPDCFDKTTGKSAKSFSRRADLGRHMTTTHELKALYSCPRHNCNRKNENGFSRMDHLIEHRRGYHKEPIAKKHGRGSGAVDGTKVKVVTIEPSGRR